MEIFDINWIFVLKGLLEYYFDVIEKKEFDFLKKLNFFIVYVFNVLLDFFFYIFVDVDSYEGLV